MARIWHVPYYHIVKGFFTPKGPQFLNGSPDMIPTAFEGKFDEKKDEIPPGICRPHILQIIQYWGVDG